MTSIDDTSLAAILAASVGGVQPDESSALTRLSPRICGTAKRPSTASGASASASCWVRHGSTVVRARDVDVLERIVGRLDVGHVDGLDLADVLEDGVELAGETVQLVVGQRQPGQAGQVGDVVSGDLRHDRQA